MGWLASWGWFFCYLTWGSSRCCSQGMAGARTFKMAIVSGLSAGEDSWKPGNSVSLFCGFLYMTSLGCLSWQKGLPPLPSRFSRVWLCETPQTAAQQAPLSTGFSRQEYWSGLPFPSPNYSVNKLYFNLKKGKNHTPELKAQSWVVGS